MTLKKGEISENDIRKENADISSEDLSDVSGGVVLMRDGADVSGKERCRNRKKLEARPGDIRGTGIDNDVVAGKGEPNKEPIDDLA